VGYKDGRGGRDGEFSDWNVARKMRLRDEVKLGPVEADRGVI